MEAYTEYIKVCDQALIMAMLPPALLDPGAICWRPAAPCFAQALTCAWATCCALNPHTCAPPLPTGGYQSDSQGLGWPLGSAAL